jgi:hypothetical protein
MGRAYWRCSPAPWRASRNHGVVALLVLIPLIEQGVTVELLGAALANARIHAAARRLVLPGRRGVRADRAVVASGSPMAPSLA